jgi:hypothetical protein
MNKDIAYFDLLFSKDPAYYTGPINYVSLFDQGSWSFNIKRYKAATG